MSSQNPPSPLPAGRMKWVWLAIAGALGLWLILLLTLAGDERPQRENRPTTVFDRVSRKPTGFDTPVAEAFSKHERARVKSAKPSAPVPVAVDQGESK
jgi:hypothetical protein